MEQHDNDNDYWINRGRQDARRGWPPALRMMANGTYGGIMRAPARWTDEMRGRITTWYQAGYQGDLPLIIATEASYDPPKVVGLEDTLWRSAAHDSRTGAFAIRRSAGHPDRWDVLGPEEAGLMHTDYHRQLPDVYVQASFTVGEPLSVERQVQYNRLAAAHEERWA